MTVRRSWNCRDNAHRHCTGCECDCHPPAPIPPTFRALYEAHRAESAAHYADLATTPEETTDA